MSVFNHQRGHAEPSTHPSSHSPLLTVIPLNPLILTLMLRQDRQSGTLTRKQEEEGGEGKKEGRKEGRKEQRDNPTHRGETRH